MKFPFKLPKINFKLSDLRELPGRVVAAVKEFRLPLDLKTIENLDREHYRLVIYVLSGLIAFMLLVGIVAFGFSLTGQEQTMVPDIRGAELAQALVRLQEKELYPRIALRFTNDPNDRGRVLEQRPLPGSIVKAGRRINLVVSRGAVVDRIENYVGKNLDEVKAHLLTLFSATRPLVSVADPPVYVYDQSSAGTILEQKPLPETEISGPVALQLVVSRGPGQEKSRIPDLKGLDIESALRAIEKARLTVVATMHKATSSEVPGRVAGQSPAEGVEVAAYSAVDLSIAAPRTEQGMVSGIFSRDLPAYPYPLELTLDALNPNGERSTLLRVQHPGGRVSIPYAVPEGTVLVLSVLKREIARMEAR